MKLIFVIPLMFFIALNALAEDKNIKKQTTPNASPPPPSSQAKEWTPSETVSPTPEYPSDEDSSLELNDPKNSQIEYEAEETFNSED